MVNFLLTMFVVCSLEIPEPPDYVIRSIRKEIHPQSVDVDSVHSFDILSYKIDLDLDPGMQYIDGFTEILCEVVYPSVDTITFDFEDMVIESILVDGVATGYDYGSGHLDVLLSPPASSGDTLLIHVSYNGYPQIHSTPFWGEGIFFTTNVIYTLQCPEGSRYWYPSWDKPFDKATIEMVFTVPDTLFFCSNGLLIDSTNSGGGEITYTWRHDYPAATYLQMFSASKYAQIHDTTGSVPIIHYIYREDSAAAVVDFANIPAAIDYYSTLFGPYPFEKFGYNEGGVGGGMEHQTNVSLGSFLITGTGAYEIIFVHELSHMWWGDMVTLVDWRHCWLNEGFATYSEALWWEYLYGSQGLKTYVVDLQNQYIGWEAGGHLYPVFDPPLQYLFSTTTYEKGACVLHMLRFLAGDSDFFTILDTYGQLYKYKNASTNDFKNVAESVIGMSLDWFFDQWIYGGGSPKVLYTVFNDTDSDSFSLLTLSESNTSTDYHLYTECEFFTGSDSFLDTVIILPSEKEDLYLLSGHLDSLIFDEFRWILTRGFTEILPEISVAIPGDGKVDLFWNPLYHSSTYLYNVFYSSDSTGGWIKVNATPIDSVHYSVGGLTNGEEYYFKINAVNGKAFESDSSSLVPAEPLAFPMNEGLLVIDETMDGSGGSPILPTDGQVDSFYQYCISPIQYTQWDCATQGYPPLDTLVQYSHILWHDDDMGYSSINLCDNSLIIYCYNGGGFVVSGWRTLNSFTQPMFDFYQIDDAKEIAVPLFKGIYGMNGYTDVDVDSAKMLSSWNWMLNYGWEFECTGGDIIGLIQSPDTLYDSLITAKRDLSGTPKYVILGFPLYFMEIDDARSFLQKALEDVGAGVSEVGQDERVRFSVGKPYPDPFSHMTSFPLSVPQKRKVDIQVYDMTGRRIITIYSGYLEKGRYTFSWNGTDDHGRVVANSIYFIRIRSGGFVDSRKIILLR
jgi:hypothetical protein